MMRVQNHNRCFSKEAEQVLESLAILQRRGQLLALLKGLFWTLAGGMLLLLTLVASLGWWGGSNLRTLGWAGVSIGVIGLAAAVLVSPLRRLAQKEAVARRIGQISPFIASDVLSASQLASSSSTGQFSPGLVAGHLRSVQQGLSRIPKSDIFPLRSLVWPGIGFCVSVCALISFYSVIPEVLETGLAALWWEQRPPFETTRKVSAKAPVVSDLKLTLRYPEYLSREERRLDAISGGLVAPYGTTVVLEGKSIVKGAKQGVVNLPNKGHSPLSVSANGMVRGRFVVGAPGPFSISLGTKALMVEGARRDLEIEIDSPPSIRLLRPSGTVEVSEDGAVTIELEAEDDHGLRQIDLVLRAGQNLKLRKTIIRLADRVKRFRTKYRWSPKSIRLGGETDVQLELEAYDNDSILGPKPSPSEPLDVRILTPISRHKSAIVDQSQTLDTLIDLLAHRIEHPPVSSRKAEKAKKRFVSLRRETEDVLGKAARLISVLGRDALTPWRVADTFVKIREDLSNQLLYESRLHGDTLGDFKKRKGVDRVTIRLLESAVIRVDNLIIEQQLSRVVTTGDSLDKQQQEIDKLLLAFSSTRAESSRRALLDAIAQMEEAIQRLQRDVEAIRGKVGDTFVNPYSVLHLDLLGSVSRLRSLLAQGDLLVAARLVKQLKTDLGRLMAGLEGGLLSFRTARFGEGERFLGELLDRVMAIEAGQLQLRRETTALQRRYQERLVEVMRGRIDSLVKKQLVRVRKMRRVLEKLKSPKSEAGRIHLARLRIALRELKLSLGQGDLDEAHQIADEIAHLAGDWSHEVEKRPNGIADLKRDAMKLNKEVADAYPKPGQLLSTRDRRRTRSQAVRQRLLLNRTRKIRAWINAESDATRFLSHRAAGVLKVVAGHMSEAISSLEGTRVRRAMGEQSTALDELARLREDLKRGDQVAPLESRPIVLRGKVDLPNPDDFEVPSEFREDILKAMHGDLPRRYQDAIKKYYETLVR